MREIGLIAISRRDRQKQKFSQIRTLLNDWPVTGSKSRACREGHASNDQARMTNDEHQPSRKAMACREATAWQANDEHARAGAAQVGGNAARVAGTSPGEVSGQCSCPGISYDQAIELEFGFGLLPGNQRFASVFGDCCFEIAEVFEIFDTLLKSSHSLIEGHDLFEIGGVTHKLPFDLLQLNSHHFSRLKDQT